MIVIAFRHGLRASELVDLRWEQTDLDQAVLHVRRVKNGTPATHPLTGRELRALSTSTSRVPRGYHHARARRTGGRLASFVCGGNNPAADRIRWSGAPKPAPSHGRASLPRCEVALPGRPARGFFVFLATDGTIGRGLGSKMPSSPRWAALPRSVGLAKNSNSPR